MPVKRPKLRHGFSLIQISALVAVAGILMVAALPGNKSSDNDKTALTRQRMQAIDDAMKGFMAANRRRPCPADITDAPDDSTFGAEVGAGTACDGASWTASTADDGGVAAGLVPVKTLGLPDEYAFDGYGRRMVYLVDYRAGLANNSALDSVRRNCLDLHNTSSKGAIQIYETATASTVKDYVMWALLSYGKDGNGAYSMQGGGSRRYIATTDQDTATNAFYTYSSGNSSNIDSFQNKFIMKESTSSFDDILWYGEAMKNTCCLGKSCVTGVHAGLYDNSGGGTSDAVAGVNIVPGDINGDGIKDLVIGNYANDMVYVVFGRKIGWPSPESNALDLNNIVDNTLYGFTIKNTSSITYFGRTLATGDVNGDGYEDIVIGGSLVTVVFGGATAAHLTTAALNGTTGLLIDYGFAGAAAGAVAIGGLDEDGYKEIIFAQESGNDTNNLWVLWGRNAAGWCTLVTVCDGASLPKTATITSIDEANGFKVTGNALKVALAKTLFSLATGDANGDGYDDLLIGGTGGTTNNAGTITTQIGHAYLMFGRTRATWNTDILTLPPDYYNIPSGSASVAKFNHAAGNDDEFGTAVTLADIDNDGYKDLLITSQETVFYYKGRAAGTWNATADGVAFTLAGASAKILGCGSAAPSWIEGTPCGAGASAAIINSSITTGDVDNDGKAEILIGVPASAAPDDCSKGANVGSVYVLKGLGSGLSTAPTSKAMFTGNTNDTCDSSEINTTYFSGSFRIDGAAAGDYAYIPAVADINGDGKNDIIVGATMAGTSDEGIIYVLWGRRTVPWDSLYDLNSIFTASPVQVDVGGL